MPGAREAGYRERAEYWLEVAARREAEGAAERDVESALAVAAEYEQMADDEERR